jgi:hypothetical protein
MTAISDQCSMRDRVERLESIIEQAPQVDCPVQNFFAPGVYLRVMTIPAGVMLTGAVHKTKHLNIVLRGHIAASTDHDVAERRGGDIFVSGPGLKRAGLALEETVWITVHENPTNETDMDKLVPMLVEATNAQLLSGPQNKQLKAQGAQELEDKQ